MNKICVYTCITGNYDNLNEIQNVEDGIDYICYTNNKKIKSRTWKVKYINDASLSNVKLARKIKILGTKELKKYDITVWVDGRVYFVTPIKQFIDKFVDLNKYDLVGFKHHCRNTVKSEIEACFDLNKDNYANLINVAKFLKKEEFPDTFGLIETTLLFRDFHNKRLNNAMKIWFDNILKYSHRDQLFFEYSEWKTNLSVNLLAINIWNNNYFKTGQHSVCDFIEISYLPINPISAFSEIVYKEYKINKTGSVEINILPKKDCKQIKLYLKSPFFIMINKIIISENIKVIYNNCINYDNNILFGATPSILLCGDLKKNVPIILRFNIQLLDDVNYYIDAISHHINNYEEIIHKKETKINELRQLNDSILNSKTWKLKTKICKVLFGK